MKVKEAIVLFEKQLKAAQVVLDMLDVIAASREDEKNGT